MSILAGLAAGAAISGVNNMFAQHNATKSYEREQKLMEKQNSMNVANAKNAYINQVEGMRMAGLNPALGVSSSPATPIVSAGSVDMAQTIPFNVQDSLAAAQIENINASTDVLKSEIPNKNADTALKVAERLYKSAGTNKVKEETQNIEN